MASFISPAWAIRSASAASWWVARDRALRQSSGGFVADLYLGFTVEFRSSGRLEGRFSATVLMTTFSAQVLN
jgi:hypothetical protein